MKSLTIFSSLSGLSLSVFSLKTPPPAAYNSNNHYYSSVPITTYRSVYPFTPPSLGSFSPFFLYFIFNPCFFFLFYSFSHHPLPPSLFLCLFLFQQTPPFFIQLPPFTTLPLPLPLLPYFSLSLFVLFLLFFLFLLLQKFNFLFSFLLTNKI